MTQLSTTTRVFLLDDDPVFCNLMAKVAKRHGVHLDAYESLMDLDSIGQILDYDVAIIDYNLQEMTGIEVGEYLRPFFAKTPVILVSIQDQSEIEEPHLPGAISQFVNKEVGCETILLTSLAAAARSVRSEDANDRIIPAAGHQYRQKSISGVLR